MSWRSAQTGSTDSIVPSVAPTSDSESVLDSTLPHLLRILRREPGVAITLAYLFVAMAGIFYNYTFYEKFGIPVLTLSQVGDFLVAGIQQPIALLLVLSTLPVIWLIDRINHFLRRRRAARRAALIASGDHSPRARIRLFALGVPPKWFTILAYVVGVVGYGWTFVELYSLHRATAVQNGEAAQVAVWLTGSAEPLPSTSKSWSYLGAVSSYVFLYDHDARRAQIVPTNAVARIQPAETVSDMSVRHVMIAPFP